MWTSRHVNVGNQLAPDVPSRNGGDCIETQHLNVTAYHTVAVLRVFNFDHVCLRGRGLMQLTKVIYIGVRCIDMCLGSNKHVSRVHQIEYSGRPTEIEFTPPALSEIQLQWGNLENIRNA